MSEREEALLGLAEAIADLHHPVKVEASEWARERLSRHDLVEADRNSVFAIDDWRRCAERGWLGLFVPTELGGSGADLATSLLTLEGIGHGTRDGGLVYALGSQLLSTQVALVRFGSREQQRRRLPGLLDGSTFGAFAITEADGGSDAFAMSATATRTADGTYRINGHKSLITFGPVCDFCIVFASTRPDAGSWGVTAFIVDADADGVRRGPLREKMGMRTTPFGDLFFDDVEVGEDAVLGREGAGARIFGSVIDVERSYVFAPQVGAMERQLDETIMFATSRTSGGRPIGDYQAVSHRIVSMKERHERARLFLYRAALAEATGQPTALTASLAKIVGCDTGIESALDASLIHGARGYVSEFEVERTIRDSLAGLTFSGSTDVLRNVVARLLGVG
ncbi:MAG: acyl-CoA dehydrogenase family protein [Ilumatobacter fluminis]|uniref:acyl-CoA dehydrogenase family protein n=1 Tax=Ilumatobacter fluminis TaxID=467091 RepID=UPI0032EFDE6D